jgi:hypothetical protein
MTDYTFPTTLAPSSTSLAWLDNTASFVSPLSGTTRTESRPGGRWSLTMTFQNRKNLTGADDPLHELEAYIFKLNGAQNRAIIPDFGYLQSGDAANAAGLEPRVDGSAQTGLSLNTRNWLVGSKLLAGDRITILNKMYVVAADATADGSGDMAITLAHPIITAAADGIQIYYGTVTARYILKNNASLAATPGIFKTILVEFEEALA